MARLMRYTPWAGALAALAIAVAYLPPQPPPSPNPYSGSWQSYPTREARLAGRLRDEYRQASARAASRALRDSLMQVISHRTGHPGTVEFLGRGGRMDSAARLVLRAAIPPVPALSPEIRAVFVMVPGGSNESGTHTYLPIGTDGRTCTVMWIVDTTGGRVLPRFLHPGDALGPCAFFTAFGMPGPGIAQWLESRGYDVAWWPDWTFRPHAPFPMEQPTAAEWLEAAVGRLGGAPTFPGEYSRYAELYWGSEALIGCATGKVAACRRYLFSSLRGNLRRPWPGVVDGNPFFNNETNRLMATLVREQGVERFARFWRSPLPPEQAFDRAFTVPFAQWAPAWAHNWYGDLDIGVSTRPREVVTTIGWIGVALAACTGLALVRRVS